MKTDSDFAQCMLLWKISKSEDSKSPVQGLIPRDVLKPVSQEARGRHGSDRQREGRTGNSV